MRMGSGAKPIVGVMQAGSIPVGSMYGLPWAGIKLRKRGSQPYLVQFQARPPNYIVRLMKQISVLPFRSIGRSPVSETVGSWFEPRKGSQF